MSGMIEMYPISGRIENVNYESPQYIPPVILPKCEYCQTRGGEDQFHPGTCANCGAPLPYIHDLEMARDPFPNDPYYKDGGVSILPDPGFYTVWGAGLAVMDAYPEEIAEVFMNRLSGR
jgi:hypothetical protein